MTREKFIGEVKLEISELAKLRVPNAARALRKFDQIFKNLEQEVTDTVERLTPTEAADLVMALS